MKYFDRVAYLAQSPQLCKLIFRNPCKIAQIPCFLSDARPLDKDSTRHLGTSLDTKTGLTGNTGNRLSRGRALRVRVYECLSPAQIVRLRAS